MMKNSCSAILILLLFLASGCSHLKLSEESEKPIQFVVQADGSDLQQNDLTPLLVDADVIYLGEIHDSELQHRVQLDILKQMIAAGIKPAIGFEFFSREQTSWLLTYTTASQNSFTPLKQDQAENALRQRLGWSTRSDWIYYFPLLELAKEHGLTVFGADIDQGIRSRMARAGMDNMLEIETLGLADELAPDSAPYRELIYQDLRDGHCNMASEELILKLYRTISVRNSYMANSIQMMRRDLQPSQPVVMILGRGHVDYNSGVKSQLQYLDEDIQQLNIGLYENRSDPDKTFRASLLEPVNGVARHDIFIVTRQREKERDDPCKAFIKK
ncbi:MAG: ChaN family lipoprotein [Gammaproteobacteria bacterium]|nr:ChaN family lipoprotein [Gammaproteobacteria bacterium]